MLVHHTVRARDEAQALEWVHTRHKIPLARLAVVGRLPSPQAGVWTYVVVVRGPGEASVSFRISEDATTVWVERIWGGRLTLPLARAHQALLPLTHGVVEGALEQVVAAWTAHATLLEVPIAQTPGRPPLRSRLVPVGSLEGALVRPGEVCAQVERVPTGHTVFGQALAGRGEPVLSGALLLRANGTVVAQSTGTVQVCADGSQAALVPLLRLDEQKVRALLDVPPHTLRGDAVSTEDLVPLVLGAGVLRRFVREDGLRSALERARASGQTERDVVVAEARAAVPGQDGRLELTMPPTVQLQEDAHGRIDVYELGTLVNVDQGALLGMLVPPVPAQPGENLLGQAAVVRDGVPFPLVCGGGVQQDGERLYAARAGALSVRGERMDVVPLYVVEGDVDPQVGNLHFATGAILIQGSVRPRITVRAAHQVLVQGDVDGGIILAGGDVMVQGAIIGGAVGRVESRGRVCAGSLLHARVSAREGVVLRAEASHSTVETQGRLQIAGPEGWLCGGETHARQGVVVARLGAPGMTLTRISMGEPSPRITERLQHLARLEVELAEAEEQLRHLAMTAPRTPPLGQPSAKRRLQDTRDALYGRRARVLEQIREIGRSLPPEDVAVRVLRELLPGVSVEMRGQVFRVGRPWGPDRIVYSQETGALCLGSTGGQIPVMDDPEPDRTQDDLGRVGGAAA